MILTLSSFIHGVRFWLEHEAVSERASERATAIVAIALARRELNRQGKLLVTQSETKKRVYPFQI